MRACCASGFTVEVIESQLSRRSAVRSSDDWLGRWLSKASGFMDGKVKRAIIDSTEPLRNLNVT